MEEMEALFARFRNMLESGDYKKLKQELNEENAPDIAEFFEDLPNDKQLLVFRLLTKDMAAEVFSYMDSDTQERIIHAITDREVRNIVDEMFLDDTVDFLEEAPANLVQKVLRNTDAGTRKLINQFLNYPENSAGSLMTIEMVKLRSHMTVAQAMAVIRKNAMDKETIYNCYVIDRQEKLIGTVSLRTLVCANEDAFIRDLMVDDVVSVQTTDDQEEVANLFKHYDWIALPVVDKEGRLVGIITVDDIMEVISQENTEDMEKMAAMLPSDDEYLKTGVFKLAKNRIVWLSVLMVSGTLASLVMSHYQALLTSVVVLSNFVTILTGTGGNAGSQASTTIIRGMALGEIEVKDTLRVVWKEIRVGALCGLILGLMNMVRMYIVSPEVGLPIMIVVSVSMAVVVVLSKTIGCLLPIGAKVLHLDPAMMAGPLISTLVDAIALIFYFNIATLLLQPFA